ncbi:MAG: hypothetical protein H0Z40_05695 [Desulfotomaculum sp.]|nr:hypothetical protein [Desulfotomaculum sp.]
MAAARQKYYIVKEPGEKLHQVLVGDAKNGTLKAMSKIQGDNLIKYKVFLEQKDRQQAEVLAEGLGDNGQYQEVIRDIETRMLRPHGSKWEKVEPVIIEKPACGQCITARR